MASNGNPWFAVSLALVGIIVGYGVATGMNSSAPVGDRGTVVADDPTPEPPPPPSANLDDLPPVGDNDYVQGNPDAKITIIEYSDFECPFCKKNHGTMVKLMEEYGDKINWVYRHYPLSFHPNAQKAAEAAECAGELGGNDGFWAMGDMIFEKGSDNTELESYATEIGLNAAKFTKCLDSDKYADKVAAHMEGGTKAGVRGTPGNIVINNKKGEAELISGAQPFDNFKKVIDDML
ncbi:MAG: DsbA family protein [Candidatus Peribacteraceae bacterium]|mgnify:CR=1 FL=1|jgi:protein-disulfide isomerase|nr:DsbA family protein [Candidatus Peribacteraceae bacterium]HCI03682.1 disulfide bond formation protein DsbA [Candidatus Peribacteria bacterium]|tara:strand:+ start:4354 stop:5058 length:705 start_codon:yes stop_codon:yes gene_type:complete